MKGEDWDESLARTVAKFLNGQGIRERDSRGKNVTDVNFMLCFNADPEDVEFTLPPKQYALAWEIVVDTAGEGADSVPRPAGAVHTVSARSLVVLRAYQPPEVMPDHSVAASLAGLSGPVVPLTPGLEPDLLKETEPSPEPSADAPATDTPAKPATEPRSKPKAKPATGGSDR